MPKRRKKALTLLEIMIVIFLIALIGSVVGFNMKKSMDKAKQFKTDTARQQLEDILNFIVSEGNYSPSELKKGGTPLKTAIEETGLVKSADVVLYDGWKERFKIDYDNGAFFVTSSHTNKTPSSKNEDAEDPKPVEE